MIGDDVIRAVSTSTGIPVHQILGEQRTPEVYRARKAVIERLDQMGWTSGQIARKVNRHHTSVLHALGRCRSDNRANPIDQDVADLAAEIQRIVEKHGTTAASVLYRTAKMVGER